jgi:alanine dehydrogenase
MALLLGDSEINNLLTMDDVVNTMENAFNEIGKGLTWNRPRSRIRLPRGFHHLMAASLSEPNVFGLKTYTSFRKGIRFMTLLYDGEQGDLLCIVQGGRCSQMRTGAVSAVGTKYMSNEDSKTVGIIGTGFQGRAQLEGVCTVRNITSIKAYDRDNEACENFCREMSKVLNIEITPVKEPEECISDSDIVITMTTAREPILFGSWLKEGMHINAAGSNHWIRREVDDEVIKKANSVVVDSKEDAYVEAGDLLYPIERGIIRWDQIHELADLVSGKVVSRKSSSDITLFESQGIAISDIATAALAYERAKAEGLGQEIPLEL